MSQTPPPHGGGSYGDLPDGPVRTVLSVPLALPGSDQPASGGRHARTASPAPRNLHRKRSSLRDEILSTVRIGALSAVVVLLLAAAVLTALIWQP